MNQWNFVSISQRGSEEKNQQHIHQQCAWVCVCCAGCGAAMCAYAAWGESAGGRPPTLPPALPFRGASSITRLGSLWMRASSRQALFSYFCPPALQWKHRARAPLKPALQKHEQPRQETSGPVHQTLLLLMWKTKSWIVRGNIWTVRSWRCSH